MLQAELHGLCSPIARDQEDLLTSSVFGHLRYVPPGHFWASLFRAARSLPIDGYQQTLEDYCRAAGFDVLAASSLDTHFWPSHPALGTPDLLLRFSFTDGRVLGVLFEVKLWAKKGAPGEADDQLVRYIKALDDLRPMLPKGARVTNAALVYLTPRESAFEIRQSVALFEDPQIAAKRVFQLQWQDVADVAANHALRAAGVQSLVLTDIAAFLERRNLLHFRGFRKGFQNSAVLVPRSFYNTHVAESFRHVAGLREVHLRHAPWVVGGRI